jgi:hypothetical protein
VALTHQCRELRPEVEKEVFRLIQGVFPMHEPNIKFSKAWSNLISKSRSSLNLDDRSTPAYQSIDSGHTEWHHDSFIIKVHAVTLGETLRS